MAGPQHPHGGPQYPQQPHGGPQYPQQPQYPPAPHHPAQHPQGYPQYAQAPQPREGIAVTTRYFPLSFMFAMYSPKIEVNGHEIPVSGWGRTLIPTPPGQYQVHVHAPYFFPPRVGSADCSVSVQPNQLVELEYKTPMWAYSGGSLGPPPQKYRGAALMIGFTVFAILFAIVMVWSRV